MTDVKFRSDVTVEYVDGFGTEESIVRAARVSTLGAQTKAEEAQGLIRYLVRERHTSPLEHCVMTFRIEMPLFVQNQLVRHRMGSFNIESGRYRELDPVFYVPNDERPVKQVGKTGDYQFEHDLTRGLAAHGVLKDTSEYAWYRYKFMLSEGVSKEVARMALPVNIYSTAYLTVNLHSALNIVKLRTSRYGSKPQHEIELVGEKIRDILIGRFPTVMEAFDESVA